MLDDEPRPGHAGRAGVVDWLAQRDLAETGRQHAGRSLFTVPSRSTLWRFDLSTAGLALLGLAGLCGLAWLVVSRNHSTAGGRAYDQRSYQTIAPRAATSAIEDLLQPLIGGTLAIVDEPLVFPPTARIHGQPLSPWRLRAEAAHEGGPPHALSAGAGSRQTPATGASCLAPPHFRESAASSERMEATTGAGR